MDWLPYVLSAMATIICGCAVLGVGIMSWGLGAILRIDKEVVGLKVLLKSALQRIEVLEARK